MEFLNNLSLIELILFFGILVILLVGIICLIILFYKKFINKNTMINIKTKLGTISINNKSETKEKNIVVNINDYSINDIFNSIKNDLHMEYYTNEKEKNIQYIKTIENELSKTKFIFFTAYVAFLKTKTDKKDIEMSGDYKKLLAWWEIGEYHITKYLLKCIEENHFGTLTQRKYQEYIVLKTAKISEILMDNFYAFYSDFTFITVDDFVYFLNHELDWEDIKLTFITSVFDTVLEIKKEYNTNKEDEYKQNIENVLQKYIVGKKD
jgi:hypothetical protein